MKFNKRPDAFEWDVLDEADHKVGSIKVDSGVSCFQPIENCGGLIVEELCQIADFAQLMTARPSGA